MDSDLISRSFVLKQIFEEQEKLKTDNDDLWEQNKAYFKGLAYANRLIIDAPTVEQPQGKWISQEDDDLKISDYRCNKCGRYQDDITNYCPDCGAKMV